MYRFRWFYHPVFVFVFSLVALAASLFIYIYWYIEVSTGLSALIHKHNVDPERLLDIETWVFILVLSILVGIILLGIFIIFVYYQKTWQLYRLQKNFIDNFTHEMKTPVTSLKLYLDTLKRYDLSSDEQKKYMDYMMQNVERIIYNIDRILNLAKIESASFRKEFVNTDIVSAVHYFCEKNADLFQNCEIKIQDPAQEIPDYPINPLLFDMLLMNILNNAVKYNTSKTPTVDISFIRENKKLHIRFADNGIGIEKKEIKKIFKKFYQSGRADDMTARGSGLGLYMVQQIAQIHRGKVTVESEGKGRGAVFTVTLKFREKTKNQQ